jgi:poly-gamma-glutamate synthesis protein (capsule biosynthesis protein)
MLGRVRVGEDGRLRAGIVPVRVEAPGWPRIADAANARAIARYIEIITLEAGLDPVKFSWEADGAWIQ